MSLRARLTVWYAVLITSVVVVFSSLAYVSYARALFAGVDRALAIDARSYTRDAATGIAPSRDLAITSPQLDTFVRIFDGSGTPLANTPAEPKPLLGAIEIESMPSTAPDAVLAVFPYGEPPGARFTSAIDSGGRVFRFALVPVEADSRTIAFVETWTSVADERKALHRLGFLLLTLGAGLSALVWIGGSFTADLALLPLRRVIRAAGQIADQRDFSQRVDSGATSGELRELTDTVNAMLRSLEQSHRAYQEFSSDAAHELRAPLTVLQGELQLLADDVMPDPHVLAQMRVSASRLAVAVDQLLLLARSDAGVSLGSTIVPLDEIVMDAIPAAALLFGSRRVLLDGIEPVRVFANERGMRQCVAALLDNAWRYGSGAVHLHLKVQGQDVQLTVLSEGEPLSNDTVQHMFDRFFRGAESAERSGSGLGLAIVRAVAEDAGGTVHARNVTRGVEVTIRLPLAAS